MRRVLLAAAVLTTLTACRGSVPDRDGPPEQGISAILISSRLILPSGETRAGRIVVNFESDGGPGAEVYRLPVNGGENYLFLVEPGTYRLAPTRSLLGFYQSTMKVGIEGRTYRLPFPREILRLDPYKVKPTKIVTLGVLEARVKQALPGRAPEITVRLDDTVAARRSVVQGLIRDMMDPTKSSDARRSTVSWSQALQRSLLDILSEESQRPMYKTAE